MEDEGPRLLVCEDDPAVRMYMATALGELGFRVFTARTGRLALERLGCEPYDVVVLDLVMPGASGLDTLRRIRQDPVWGDLPVVVVSALSDDAMARLCLEAGATACLAKPVALSELVGTLRRILISRGVRRLMGLTALSCG